MMRSLGRELMTLATLPRCNFSFIFVVLEGFGLADWSISGDFKAPMGSSITTNLLCLMFNDAEHGTAGWVKGDDWLGQAVFQGLGSKGISFNIHNGDHLGGYGHVEEQEAKGICHGEYGLQRLCPIRSVNR
jgi:hypothetical protein